MLRSVLLKSLRDLRRSFAWWTVGLAGLVALMLAVYPTVRDNPDLNRLVEEYPDALKAFIKVNDWNQAHIIARGNMITEILNGHVTSTLVDDDTKARAMAERDGVEIKLYRIIYEAVADVRLALEGMLRPEQKFDGFEALVEQIRRDVTATREWFA